MKRSIRCDIKSAWWNIDTAWWRLSCLKINRYNIARLSYANPMIIKHRIYPIERKSKQQTYKYVFISLYNIQDGANL